MATKGKKPSLAILIDAENTGSKYADAVFKEVATRGEANVRRAYGDFIAEPLKGWRGFLQSQQFELRQQFNNTSRKNATDIALVVDAMDLMYRGGLDGYCLVSSDSDFTRLAQRLRESGAVVYGFGEKSTPKAFRDACTEFFHVEDLIESIEVKPKSKAKPRQTAKTDPPTKIVPQIREAMEQAWDEGVWVELEEIERRLKRRTPDFDPNSFGYPKLRAVVEKCGEFELDDTEGPHVRIRRRAPL